jgi:hypothetical protein
LFFVIVKIKKMHSLIKTSIVLLLFLLPAFLFGQETTGGITIGSVGKTNMKAVADYEAVYPVQKTIKKTPNHVKVKPVIANPAGNDVIPFSGKVTLVKLDEAANNQQRTQEFPCINFNALNDDGTSFPPDVNGAVGFDHLVTTLNTEVRVQNKQGGVISTVSLTGFWNGLGGHTDIFDPKITYDPYDRRWIFITGCIGNTGSYGRMDYLFN